MISKNPVVTSDRQDISNVRAVLLQLFLANEPKTRQSVPVLIAKLPPVNGWKSDAVNTCCRFAIVATKILKMISRLMGYSETTDVQH